MLTPFDDSKISLEWGFHSTESDLDPGGSNSDSTEWACDPLVLDFDSTESMFDSIEGMLDPPGSRSDSSEGKAAPSDFMEIFG